MPEEASERSREGEVLVGKYKLEERLGSGGMGEVYRAQNVMIGRDVAIKLLLQQWVTDGEIVARFLREAHAANMVRHPNVVDVLDVGKDESGAPFIVQEFLQGEDLARYLESAGGRLPTEAAIRLVIPVVEAMGFAHAKGVVHRDIKPENIFLAEVEGEVVPKILDFGISKILGPEDIRMTATGVAMGTPAYMSPEHIQGTRDADARSDVWSLGVMLFELLAHELPFDGKTPGDLFVKICTEDPARLSDVAPQVSNDLAKLVMRCLRRNPDERYANASELAVELRSILDGKRLESGRPARKKATSIDIRTKGTAATQGYVAAPKAKREVNTIGASKTALPTADTALATRRSRITGSAGSADDVGRSATELSRGDERTRTPVRDATRNIRSRAQEGPKASSGFRSVFSAGFVALALVGALGLRAMVSSPSAGWPVLSWWYSFTRGISPAAFTAVTLVFLAGAVSLVVQSLRMYPASWGLLLSAAGMLTLVYFCGRAVAAGSAAEMLHDPTARRFFPLVAPWAMAMVPAGLGWFGLGRSASVWKGRDPGGKVLALFYLNLSVLALFAALQTVRGVWTGHDTAAVENTLQDVSDTARETVRQVPSVLGNLQTTPSSSGTSDAGTNRVRRPNGRR